MLPGSFGLNVAVDAVDIVMLDRVIFSLVLASAVVSSWVLYRFGEEPARRYLSARPYFRDAGTKSNRPPSQSKKPRGDFGPKPPH